MRPAVFLDRDGTIITSVHYLADPELVRLIDGAATAIRARERPDTPSSWSATSRPSAAAC